MSGRDGPSTRRRPSRRAVEWEPCAAAVRRRGEPSAAHPTPLPAPDSSAAARLRRGWRQCPTSPQSSAARSADHFIRARLGQISKAVTGHWRGGMVAVMEPHGEAVTGGRSPLQGALPLRGGAVRLPSQRLPAIRRTRCRDRVDFARMHRCHRRQPGRGRPSSAPTDPGQPDDSRQCGVGLADECPLAAGDRVFLDDQGPA